jgi:hypothetical protein
MVVMAASLAHRPGRFLGGSGRTLGTRRPGAGAAVPFSGNREARVPAAAGGDGRGAAGPLARRGRGANAVIDACEDLAGPVPRRTGTPPSMRWALVHRIEETGRHAGHADILRELVDGSTGR